MHWYFMCPWNRSYSVMDATKPLKVFSGILCKDNDAYVFCYPPYLGESKIHQIK